MTTKTAQPGLARRLGLFDATMIVMGGIIGSGIFVNPAAVARHVGTPGLIVGAWLIGGAIALVGALVYAELAARRPETGGQYAYLRDAWGPVPAFLYGWSLLLVIQSGGMAAVATIFASYLGDLVALPAPRGRGRRRGAGAADPGQLPRRARRQQRPERADGAQDRRHRRGRRRRPAARAGRARGALRRKSAARRSG